MKNLLIPSFVLLTSLQVAAEPSVLCDMRVLETAANGGMKSSEASDSIEMESRELMVSLKDFTMNAYLIEERTGCPGPKGTGSDNLTVIIKKGSAKSQMTVRAEEGVFQRYSTALSIGRQQALVTCTVD